jgi:hypothetical protein
MREKDRIIKDTLVSIVSNGQRHIFMVKAEYIGGHAKIPLETLSLMLKRAGIGSQQVFSIGA